MDDNIKKLHQALIDDGYDDVGTEQEFRDYVSDSKNVATLYNALSEAGYDNFKDQKSLETYLSAKAPVAQKPSTPQSSGQSVYSKEKKQTQYPQEVIDAFNSPDNKPGNFKDLAQLNDEYQRGELKKPGIISQALGMFSNVDAGNVGKEQKVGGMIANMLLGDNMQQPHDNNQQVQHLNQDNVPATEQTKPTAKDADAITSAAPVQQVDAIYNKYVGKGDALSETMYDLMASGQAKNQEEAQNMAMGAMNRAASRLAQRTTDEFVSKLGDTVEGVDEAVMNGWHSHAVQDNLKKLASQYGIMNNVVVDENGQYITQTNGYDQFINGMVKPAMVESLVKKYGENYRKTAEDLATRLYSNDEVIQNQLMNQDINAALVDVIGKYVNPSVVEEYNKAQEAGSKAFNEGMEGSQFIPANLRLGTALGAQYEANEAKDPAKVLSSLQKKFGRLYRNPEFLNDMSNAAFKVMKRYGLNGTQSSDPKQFKPMINSVLKNELDQLEIKGMMPKGSAEYIWKNGLGNTIVGKITRKAVQTDYQNWLEDIANQQYQPGFWENVASGALTFAGDAWSYWLPGAAGGKLTKSMVAKAEGKLAGDLMAKGMERKMAERAAKVLIGKSKAAALKGGAAHGAVTFGGQSAISKPIDEIYRTGQFDENGKIYNPSVGKVIANTLGEVAKQTAVGAIMQGGTIANMVGKGRGLATNILADIGGKVADSSIMTGQQILERMAHDPNFKPTGKDAAESFLESMANLTAIGLPGMVGKYARFKDAREFNKKFDFTDQDIAELKRFGYDGLLDAFEKVGIGEYAVEGENAQRLDGQLTQKYMNLMNDKSVPEVLKAKMMAVVEGKRPSSFSPVIDSEVYRGDDGKYYLETYNKDGDVIDRKEYSSHDAARNDEKKLEYEKTLGLASVLEGEFHNEFTQEHLEGLYNKAAQKYNMGEKLTDEDKAAVYLHQNAGAIKEIMDKQQKGIILTDEEQKLVNAYRHYYDSALENSSVMREFVNTFEDSHDVAHGTLRKALESKDKKYAPLVESYLKELYNSIELKREMKQTMDDLYKTSHGNEQKRIEGESPVSPVEGSSESSAGGQEPPVSEGPAPYQDRTNSVSTPSDAEFAANSANLANENQNESKASDAFVMGQNAYKNGDKEGLKSIKYNAETAELRLKRAFANDTDRIQGVYNAVNKGTDIETYIEQRTNYLTPFQQEAIRKYAEAMDANKGAMDALEHADDGYADMLKQQLSQYTMENGNISSLTLTDGQRGYWKSKNEYGAGFGVFPDANGQPVVKQVPSSQVKENGKEIPLQEYVNQLATQKHEATKKNFNAIFDTTSLKPNDTVSLSINDKDQPTEAKIVSVNPDGTISFNIAGSKNVTTVPVDTFTKFQKYALRNSINADLDAEDAERAEKEAIKVEAEKKQRFANGIVGLSEQKPDYSSKETDPKVAAEYLQEQYADNHDQLIKLVNGSRSDIKEQIDNIRKRIVEAEDWLDTNADLEPEQAQSREDKLKLAKEQLEDLTTRYDNWNKIRSLIMTEEEKRELKDERTANIKKVGIDKEALTVTDEREVPVLTDEDLKKQYPTMDEASDYILSQRKEISKTQEELHRQLEDIDDRLNQYLLGESDFTDEEIRDFNTTKADLEARMANLSASAKDLIAQNDSLKKLYKLENQKAREEALNDMSPAEQRRVKAEQYLNDRNISGLAKLYADTSVDFMDDHPYTVDEYVASSIGRHALNYEGREVNGTFLNGLQQEFGGTRKDLEKIQVLAAEGKGQTFDKYVNGLYDNLPDNLRNQGVNTQEIRNSLLALLRGAEKYSDLKNYILKEKIAHAEEMRSMDLAEEEQRAAYEEEKEQQMQEQVNDVSAKYSLSSETAGNGEQFYQDAEGNIDLANVPQEVFEQIGYTAAPFRLTPKMIKHMMDRHNTELKFSSPDEAIDFVRDVMNNFDHVRLGYDGALVFSIEDGRRRTGKRAVTILINNDNGKFYGLKTSGYESVKGLEKRPLLWERGANEKTSSTDAATASVTTSKSSLSSEQSGSASHQGNDLNSSGGKDTNNSDNLQEKGTKFSEKLQNAIAETETEPTEAQKKAGNYKKGHLSFGGYDFTVETPKGVTRSGKDEQGKPWIVTMHDTYGYILGKIGVDGDHIDMFINDAADLDTFDGNVYVVDQVNPDTGEFDEHKVMYGYPSEEAATEAYLANYSKGWKGLGKVTSVPKATFDKWLESSDRKTKPFADYAMIKKDSDALSSGQKYPKGFEAIVNPNMTPELQKAAMAYSDALSSGQKDENLPFAPMNMDDLPFHRDVKEVKPSEMTEAQKVAYDAVSTMLKKAGIPVKVVSNEDMEKVAEAQDNLAVEMLLNDPRLRFYIKTPEQKEAAKAAYDWAAGNRPDKFKQYAIVNMDNPNEPPQYFEKKDLAEKWRKYYTNAWKIGNYKAFNLNKPFEEQIKDVKGDVPSEFDPYKAESLLNKRIELEKQIKETEDSYNAKKKERAEYQNQLMQDYMDQHGLSSENDIPDDVWTDYRDKSFEKYQDTLDDLFHKYVELDNQLKAVAEPGVRFLRTYHGSGANFDKFDLSHALEGEGSETFGHGVYVTNSKEIGTDYAQRAKDKKAIFGFEFVNPQSMSKEAQDMLRHYMYKHQDVAKGLENARKDLKDVIGKFPDTDYLQELNEILAKDDDSIAIPSNRAYRYDVDIPDDNGSNYLGWNESQNFPLEKWYRLWEITHNGFSENEYFKDGGARYDIDRIERITQMKLESPENGMQKLPTLKGEELYHALEDFFDRERPSYGAELASRALGEIGFVGIKYPAGMIHGGAKEGDYNYVVFDENNANIVGNTKFAQGKGVVYGYTDGKEIVLNQEHLNPNTPIHEYQHLWRTAAKKMNPELIEHGDKLIMQTQLFADLKQDPNYNHLTDEQICDEAFARLTGEDGAAILEQMAKDAIKENPLDTAKELSVINKLKEWLKKFWYWTLDTFTKWKPENIKKMTLEDIRNLVLRDLANGVDPRTKLHEAENADDIKFMGSTTKKRMKDISTQLEGRELDEAQQAVADVYSGKKDNVSLTVEREDGSNKIIMRQGNDNHAGTKHSVFRHYGVKANSLNVDDLLLIPTVLKEGERKVSDNGRVAYVYVDPTSQVKYTVVTEPKNNKEYFNDFYSNKKANPSETSRVVENSTNTPEGAHNNDGNAFMRAKVDNNSETAKENGGNLSVEDKIKAVSQQFGVDEADVAMYANAIKKGSTSEAARARANIKRHLLQVNEGNIFSFKDLVKYTVPVNNALKENFGDLDAMIEERVKQVEAQRNAMEAARKRAEEEEAKRQKHLEELSLIPDDQLDKQYMDALAKGDDATAREMLDEAARRKGYDDTESSYQGVGAWAAPGNPGYESDKARRDDWESSGSDVNLEDMALGYTPQPDDYFSHPERYSQNTPHGLESVKAINAAIDAIKNGEKDVKVKVYRAVPTSVKESKLRNGDWVTPSKKYAEMHGTNRLEGKYRIIEDEVPANQLWWDGNDANEFGFDDGKAYKYKNAKNNRKLNDLVTYDDKGDVIPPSKRFNSRKSDVRFHRSDGANLPSEEDNKPKKKTERGRIDEATGAFKLAPNGEQSNLSKKQYIEARTKNFKEWFGGDWEKKPKDFKNKLDANGEPLEKYVEGYLNRPKKPSMPKKRKGEDEATFFGRKMLYSQALEDWPKTEADWKKRIDEFDENTLAALTPPDEEAIREKYQKQYENDMASWRKDHPKIKEGEERPLKIPDMRDYQSIQDYGEAMGKYEIWKTAPHKDEYDRMAEDEIISKVALMDAVQHPFSEYARLKAMKAEFQHMRHVMQNQKVYDKNTTDAVVQFAKRFMSLGYGDDLGRGSINTLLTIVKNSTGKKSYEISQQLYQVMDVLMNNQLRNFDRAVMKTMSIKELKENAKGIQVQGKLELRGQTTIKAFRDAVSSRVSSDKLDERISNLIDKMAADKRNASSYQDELLGLNLAKQYVDYIDSSRNDAIEIEDLKKLEIENYKDRKGIYKGERTKALLQEHVERLNQYDEALFNNKVERMDRYSQLLANLGGMIDESVKGAREFQERDARRAINVKMMASADLGDKSMNQHHKENWKTRLSNSDLVQGLGSPLGSFDALMREFGSKQINGEGQLWNHFVRGAMKASNDEFKSVREANNEIDLKVSELFGKVTEDKNGNKKGNMTLNDLYALERSNKVKSLDVIIRDIEGEQTYKLQQGNLMYIYMVNKMPDGAMKLREMRILDADVERIKENIDPRFLKLADWIQGEFLPKMRTKYNKRHEELFGAPMPMVENYFPLRVLKNARYMEEDVNNTSDNSNALPSTATGAIIKRKTNKLPLDILNADALSVTIDNIKEMENWYNYAPIRKDANTLLSDTTFRNRVQNMTTIYGSGETLWNNVKDATAVAMGTYRPTIDGATAVALRNFGKGITGAKISFRLYTAFKQVLSAPLFLPDVDLGRFVRHSVHPYGSFKWAIENLPNFDKRWSGRKLGDTVLMDDPTDWKLWHTNLMEKAAYYGMTPNALVDAVTCAVGARAVYDTKYKQYIKYGLTEEKAKEKALSDAEINFNTSQQSSEGAFVSPMQLDKTLGAAILTPFRNSSMLYERKGINALRNLKHRFEKGHKEASIKFMAGQLMEEGVGYEQATKAAEKMYQKGLMHNIADAIVALWLGAIIWNLGGSLGYLMFGDDNEKKKKMVIDAVILGLLEGPVDGLAGGQFINTAIANTITSDGISLKGLKNVDFSGMPMLSDFNSMIEKFGYDKVAGVQDLMFIVMQSATGFNPKTLTDAINACIDYGNGDMTNAKEIALFVFRLMNGPAATVDNLYIDELGMKGKDAKKLSYEELAKRYAEYKFGKNTFGLGKLYSDEEKQKKLKAIEKSFDKKVSERLAGMDREDLKNEFSESRSQKEKKLIGKIIADELETKDSEAVKKAKADASYLRQRNFSDLMDDLYLQKEWEATNEANAGLEELKGNGASEKEIEAYKTKHKAALDKRKAIQKARKKMQKKKADISSDNDEATMAAIRKLRDSILKTVRQTKK